MALTPSASAFASGLSFTFPMTERGFMIRPMFTEAARPTMRPPFDMFLASAASWPPRAASPPGPVLVNTSCTTSCCFHRAFRPRASSPIRACAATRFALSPWESGVSAMIAARSEG